MAKDNLVDAVIVAAGQSARYGSNKLLEDLCGRPVIIRAIDATLLSRMFCLATFTAMGSISRPIMLLAPNLAEAMERIPDPHPTSTISMPGLIDVSIISRHIFVVG